MRNKCLVNTVKQKKTRQILRITQTDAEAVLWEYLRGKKFGVRFVRQYGIANYIVDFCCRSQKLVIEIDGCIHDKKEIKEKDLIRTKDLERFGYKIIRFRNQEIFNGIDLVLAKIKSLL